MRVFLCACSIILSSCTATHARHLTSINASVSPTPTQSSPAVLATPTPSPQEARFCDRVVPSPLPGYTATPATPSPPAGGQHEVTSVEPREVHSNGRVVVRGHGFGVLPGQVAFGGDTAGAIFRWTDTEIEVDVPSGAPRGTIAVEVRFPTPENSLSFPPYHPMPGEATPEPTPTPAPTPDPWVARGGEIYVRNYLLPGREGSFVPSDVIFGIREGQDPEEIASRHCIEEVRPISDASFPYYVGHVPVGREAETILALAADPGVTSANPNGVTHAT